MTAETTGVPFGESYTPPRAQPGGTPPDGITVTDATRRRLAELAYRGAGRVSGLAFLALGLAQYRSAGGANLGRWSPAFAAVLLVVTALWGWAVVAFVRRGRRTAVAGVGRIAFEAAVLLWGLGYFLAALDSPATAGQLLDGNLLGSLTPSVIAVHWVVAALLVVALAARTRSLSGTTQNVAVLGVATCVALLLGEGWVRARAIVAPTTQGYPTNTSRLWQQRHVTLNRIGFRDAERTLVAAPGVRRVLLVGDSYAQGSGLDRTADRFGERLEARLGALTGARWEVVNASRSDRHTLNQIEMLRCMLPARPEAVVLLYVFNDIDYLRAVTPRRGPSEAPRGVLDRVDPRRLAFLNSFLYQELYVRVRAVALQLRSDRLRAADPYADSALVARHLADVRRFVELARASGAEVAVVPFDVAVRADESIRRRYARFVSAAGAAGVPVISLERAFDAQPFADLTVNELDRHPNALAHRLAAEAAAPHAAAMFRERPGVAAAPPSAPTTGTMPRCGDAGRRQ